MKFILAYKLKKIYSDFNFTKWSLYIYTDANILIRNIYHTSNT